MIGTLTNRKRRGILVTLLSTGLVLVAGLGVALAVSMTAKPDQGSRDDGTGNQTTITMSGDMLDAGSDAWAPPPQAYWDTPKPSTPDPAYSIPVPGSAAVNPDGTFTFNVDVPVTDGSGQIVRPADHLVTVCSTGRSTGPVCVSAAFKVLGPTTSLSRSAGRPGEAITVHGERFSPDRAGDLVRVQVGPSTVYQARPGSSTFDVIFTVPSIAAGDYTVLTCNAPSTTAPCNAADTDTQAFTVLTPKLKLSPNGGLSGNSFDITGSGFYSKRTLHLFFGPVGASWNDPSVTEISPGVGKGTDGNGDLATYSYAPSAAAGPYWVTACTVNPSASGCDAGDTVTATYTVQAPTPSPTPSPTRKPTATPTASPTPKPTTTPTASPTATPTPTASPTASLTASPSPTRSPSPNLTPSPAPTVAPVSAPPTGTPSAPPTVPPTAAPTAAPTPTSKPVVTWPEHLRSPGQTASGGGLDLGALGGMSLLALLIAFLVPFPGTLFNKTVEANHTEIMGWIAGLKRRWTSLVDTVAKGPLGPVRRWLARLLAGRFGVLIFLGMSALVYSFLSPTFGLDTTSLALFLGLVVGLAFVTAAFDLPLRIYHGRTSRAHDRGVLRALWWTLLVAVICVVVSRLANFQPGYLYGLIVSIVFVTEISRRDEGVGTWLAAIWLLILSFVAWILLAFVRQGAFDPWLSLFLQTVLATFVVAGIETLAVGLLPMRFLPGHPLFQWRRGLWFVLFALAVMAYLLILVDPANGYLSDDSRTPMLIGVIFLVSFGLVSVGTWAYFRFRPKGARIDRPGEAPTA